MITQVAVNSFNACRAIAPFDTGNLIFNGMRLSILNNNQFVITYSVASVPYIESLEEGTKFIKQHIDFIKRDSTFAVAQVLQNAMSQQSITENKNIVAARSKNNPARNKRFLNSISV